MRDFPWLEAALIIALAVALIVKPQSKIASGGVTQPAYEASIAR